MLPSPTATSTDPSKATPNHPLLEGVVFLVQFTPSTETAAPAGEVATATNSEPVQTIFVYCVPLGGGMKLSVHANAFADVAPCSNEALPNPPVESLLPSHAMPKPTANPGRFPRAVQVIPSGDVLTAFNCETVTN